MADLRKTAQKNILDNELKGFNSFFSAEELFNKVKSKKIGIATVYRFLNEAEKKHDVHSYLCNRKSLYSRNSHNHCHFICQNCDKMVHFSVDSIDPITKKIKGDICHFQIEVSGICQECNKK